MTFKIRIFLLFVHIVRAGKNITVTTHGGMYTFSSRQSFFHREGKQDCFEQGLIREYTPNPQHIYCEGGQDGGLGGHQLVGGGK